MESPIAEIKPNIKKAFISDIGVIAVVVALIAGTLIYLNNVVGLGVFLDTFKEFGIEISTAALLGWGIFLLLFITTIILILDYVALGKSSYVLYPDKLVYSKNIFIIQLSEQTIPYPNIVKIGFKKQSFLNTSKLTLELTSMKKDNITIEFLDNAQEVATMINKLISDYKSRYYAQYTQNYSYQNIMDKL